MSEPRNNSQASSSGPSAWRRLVRYPVNNPGSFAVWVFIAALLYLQWPMLKGTYYRVSGAPAPEDGIAWRTDFAAAVKEAKAAGKPLLLDFTASWCPPCQVMKREAWPDARVREAVAKSYIPVLVDVDREESQELSRRYNIETIPHLLIINTEGKVQRTGSFMSADELARWLADPPAAG